MIEPGTKPTLIGVGAVIGGLVFFGALTDTGEHSGSTPEPTPLTTARTVSPGAPTGTSMGTDAALAIVERDLLP